MNDGWQGDQVLAERVPPRPGPGTTDLAPDAPGAPALRIVDRLPEAAPEEPPVVVPAIDGSYVFDHLSAIATMIDRDGTIVATNQAWQLFASLNGGAATGTGPSVSYLDVCDRAAASGDGEAAAVAKGLRSVLSREREQFDIEYPCSSASEDRWFLLQASAAPVHEGGGAVLLHVDITAGKVREQKHASDAGQDHLTGLPNRRSAVRRIEEELAAATVSGAVWVLYFDLDDFKIVNDTHGHHTGDELLVKVASRVRRTLRADDRLFRIGGDEFVIVCRSLTPSGAAHLGARIREVVGNPYQIGRTEVSIGMSIGAGSSSIGSTVDSLLLAADAQMYHDKGRRRHRIGRTSPRPDDDQVPGPSTESLVWQDDDAEDRGRRTVTAEHLRLVLDALDHGVVVQDANGSVVDANAQACALLDQVSVTTTTVPSGWSLIDNCGRPLADQRLPGHLTMSSCTPEREVVGLTDPTGATRWLEFLSQPIRTADGDDPYAVVSSIHPAAPPPPPPPPPIAAAPTAVLVGSIDC